MLHVNIRSLSKNFDSLYEFVNTFTFKPDKQKLCLKSISRVLIFSSLNPEKHLDELVYI